MIISDNTGKLAILDPGFTLPVGKSASTADWAVTTRTSLPTPKADGCSWSSNNAHPAS